MLRRLKSESSLPWIVGRDFNELLQLDEKDGGSFRSSRQIEDFREATEFYGLRDLGFCGPQYTWCNGRYQGGLINERLDRVLATDVWMALFPNARVTNLVSTLSDHCPFLLELEVLDLVFRLPGDCSGAWKQHYSLDGNLLRVKAALSRWSQKEFGDLPASIAKHDYWIRRLSNGINELRLVGLQRGIGILNTFILLLLRDGKIIPLPASNNTITGLFDGNGIGQTKREDIAHVVFNHYAEVYHSMRPLDEDINRVITLIQPKVTVEINVELGKPFCTRDVFEALQQMGPFKSPGPDGLNAAFFQKMWPTVGHSVTQAILQILHGGPIPSHYNHTNVVLILKIKAPQVPSDFRPISLYNVIMKLVSKCMVNRMRSWLPEIISSNQSGFIAGRSIFDNATVAFGIVHSLLHKCPSRKGFVALKLDVKKAYDRPSDVLFPKRGFRQGDPLSPILFVLCSEAFTVIIKDRISRGLLQGAAVSWGGPRISHLLFADDSLVFFRATLADCQQFLQVLKWYKAAAGQEINFSKSNILFSKNVADDCRLELKQCLGVFNSLETNKYLGLPIVLGRNKNVSFDFLRNRLRRKLAGWKGKYLSKAGREVLVKAVLQALPTYVMSLFQLSDGLCHALEMFCARFLWGAKDGERKIHWIEWDSLCEKKKFGGLGFRELKAYNLALTAKQGWRFLLEPDNMMTVVLKQKYFPRTSFIHAELGNNPSSIWRGMIEARNILIDGGHWLIGDGLEAHIFSDKWFPLVLGTKIPLSAHLLWPQAKAIHIAFVPCQDQWIWDHNANGVYTVKSGYFVAKQLLHPGQTIAFTTSPFGHWNLIWQLDLLPNLRLFAWKLCQGIVSTRDNLIGQGLQSISGHCEQWLQFVFSILSKYELNSFIAAAWWVWSNRNDYIFRAKCAIPSSTVSGFQRWFLSFSSLVSVGSRQVSRLVTRQDRWKPPVPGIFKVNFDAGFVLGSSTNRFDTIVRDHCGRCIGAWSGKLGRQGSVLPAEAIAALKSIELVRRLNLDAVIFEGDCQELIKELNSSSRSFSVIGNITKEFKHFIDSYFSSGGFSFVKHGGNRPAHVLAHYVFIVDLVTFDCNNLPHDVAEVVHLNALLA
ncbi:uncharacterized protein [Rutidosis leptorrhynchoides]|uniref:uncharacterized protein n=1 Tax=Rutidosis leptorrhynchoides TaxID=125765 RepID=UPI003A9A5796